MAALRIRVKTDIVKTQNKRKQFWGRVVLKSTQISWNTDLQLLKVITISMIQ
jgi:hypothetical protein